MIGDLQPAYLTGIPHGNKSKHTGFHAIFRRRKTAVTDAVAALIGIQFCFYGLPAGIPHRIPVFYVKILPVHVTGYIIITVTGQAQQLCILIKSITTAGIGNQAEKIITAKVVDPGKRCFRGSDHVLTVRIIEMTKFHIFSPS